MMRLDPSRIRAVVRKELRDYRRKRSIVVTMAVLPAIFLIQPTLSVFLGSPSTASDRTYYAPSSPLPAVDSGHHALAPWPPTRSSASASRGHSNRCSPRRSAGRSSSWARRRRS